VTPISIEIDANQTIVKAYRLNSFYAQRYQAGTVLLLGFPSPIVGRLETSRVFL